MFSDAICWLQNTVSGTAGVRWSDLQKTYTAYQGFVRHWLVRVRVRQMYSIDSNPHSYCAYWSDILEGILTLQTFLALFTFPFCLSHEICESVSIIIVVAWVMYNTIEASLLGCYKRVHLESRRLCRSMCTFSKTRKKPFEINKLCGWHHYGIHLLTGTFNTGRNVWLGFRSGAFGAIWSWRLGSAAW